MKKSRKEISDKNESQLLNLSELEVEIYLKNTPSKWNFGESKIYKQLCKLNKFVWILVFLLFNNLSFAYEVDKANAGDTLENIARRNLHKFWKKHGGDYKLYANDIKKWNPNIKNWNHLLKNQIIYIDNEPNQFNEKVSLNTFFASSFGKYTEVTSEQTVKSGQNFPITLGLGLSAMNDEKVHFILASFYWAQPSRGSVSGNSGSTTTTFSIPGEIGTNLYYQYYFKENKLSLYSGYDFEKLNTFNTDQIVTGASVTNIDNKIHYATFGATKSFTLFNLNMNLKASVSKSITSSTSGTRALAGTKYILYYTYKPEGLLSFSAFYKHHMLSGTTKLAIDRIGFSVGVLVF